MGEVSIFWQRKMPGTFQSFLRMKSRLFVPNLLKNHFVETDIAVDFVALHSAVLALATYELVMPKSYWQGDPAR